MTTELKARAVAHVTDVGRFRKRNEDRALTDRIFAVADGMGGRAAGDKAAQIVVDSLAAMQQIGHTDSPDAIHEIIRRALVQAADDIARMVEDDWTAQTQTEVIGSPPASGSTVAGFYLAEVPTAFHIGDSRVYVVRDGELSRITHDHTLVQQLIDSGELTDEEAHVHPRKNVITRAIGTFTVPAVEFTTMDLRVDDIVLVCSDGLTDELMDAEIQEILAETLPAGLDSAAYALRDSAISAGGHDNITIVLVQIGD